jgi:Family of unknown function (DUF6884)
VPKERQKEVCLISCVAKKGPSPAPAKELYQSPWFILARRYVKAKGAPWFILSAKYGLVDPDDCRPELSDYALALTRCERL